MTGEVTITGRVLAIGGLREKTMAAYAAGVGTVLIPAENMTNLDEVDKEVKAGIRFIPCSDAAQVLKEALAPASARPAAPADGESPQTAPFILPLTPPDKPAAVL